MGVTAAALLLLVAGLAVSGLGNRVAARLLLNAGTADLNRGSLSETIRREDRTAALDRANSLLRPSTMNGKRPGRRNIGPG